MVAARRAATLAAKLSDGSTQTIEATGNHPFWVASGKALSDRPLSIEHAGADAHYVSPPTAASGGGGRWCDARDLALGDRLLAREFDSATVIGLQTRTERTRVYNLTVLRHRNYAVAAAGVLVHNTTRPFDDIASFRQSLGLPAAGTEAGKKWTVARLDVDGTQIYGLNGGLPGADDAAKFLQDLAHASGRKGPTTQFVRHAEGDALVQAFNRGIGEGKNLVLYVDAVPCRFCQNSFENMRRLMGAESLTVLGPGFSRFYP